VKNVALLSSSYSGSTLLSILACSHPKVIGFGDTYNYQFVRLPETRCTCGASPSCRCPIRVSLESKMKEMGYEFRWTTSNPTPLMRGLRGNRAAVRASRSVFLMHLYRRWSDSVKKWVFARYYQENLSFLRALEECGDYECYFDGCKSLSRLELMRVVLPDTKVVHLVRDPRGCLHSALKRGQGDYRRVVDGWCRYNLLARRYRDVLGEKRYLLVLYEELATHPESVLAKVHEFMGVPPHRADIGMGVDKSGVHVVGNRMKESLRRVENHSLDWGKKLEGHQLDYVRRRVAEMDWLSVLDPVQG
jgi:hypothetical protein